MDAKKTDETISGILRKQQSGILRKEQLAGRNIYQRVHAVMVDVSYIKKDTSVNNQYKAVSHDAVVSTIRPFLIKHGIVVTTSLTPIENSFQVVQHIKNVNLFRAVYSVKFINMDKPEDYILVSVEAHALCNDDKAPGKTYSYALKMAILKTFCIETGENDEVKTGQPEPEQQGVVTLEQAEELKSKAVILKKYKKVLDAVGVSSYDQIPASKYGWTNDLLNKQINEKLEEESELG